MTDTQVWLKGDRFDVAYLLELETGRVSRFVTKGHEIGPTGGFGRRVSRGTFVGWFVDPRSETLKLHVGQRDFELGSRMLASAVVGPAGLYSRLEILTDDGERIRLKQRTLARALLLRFDPAYDELDESIDDFLAQVAHVVNSDEAQVRVLDALDPRSGPWNLL